MAFKEARKADSLRFSSSRETLAALTQKRKALPSSFSAENLPPDSGAAPFPQYDPADEAGFESGNAEISPDDDSAPQPTIPLSAAVESVPATIRSFLRERFHAEFSNLRSPRKGFFREDDTQESVSADDELAPEADET